MDHNIFWTDMSTQKWQISKLVQTTSTFHLLCTTHRRNRTNRYLNNNKNDDDDHNNTTVVIHWTLITLFSRRRTNIDRICLLIFFVERAYNRAHIGKKFSQICQEFINLSQFWWNNNNTVVYHWTPIPILTATNQYWSDSPSDFFVRESLQSRTHR